MEIKELRIKNEVELRRLLSELQDKLRDLKFRLSSEQFKNVREIRKTKRTIARIRTLLKEGANKNKTNVKKS